MVKQALEKELGNFSNWQLKPVDGPSWRSSLAQKAFETFEKSGFPTTRDEDWKYTNVAPVIKQNYVLANGAGTRDDISTWLLPEAEKSRLVFIDGVFSPALSDTTGLPAGVVIGNLAELSHEAIGATYGSLAGSDTDAFTALNTAVSQAGAFILIPRGKVVETPIQLLFANLAAGAISNPRVLFIAEEGSVSCLIESFAGKSNESASLTNAVTEIYVAKDANLRHFRIQEEALSGYHIGSISVNQEQASHYVNCAISLGASLCRQTLNVRISGSNSETVLDGLYLGTGKQHVDNHTTIDHACRHSSSSQLYKGILDDSARAVFNGRVFVREGALLTDAKQLNKNLLLSPNAHVDTKPQLEIFADDVKCAHGATVGQLEDDELFYLRSRGLGLDKARALLTYGFAEDVISRITVKSVKKRLDSLVLERLHQQLEVE